MRNATYRWIAAKSNLKPRSEGRCEAGVRQLPRARGAGFPIDGATSEASPLFSGLVAVADQFPGTFTVQGFSAGRGYDLATGLGTPDGSRLIQELAGGRGRGR